MGGELRHAESRDSAASATSHHKAVLDTNMLIDGDIDVSDYDVAVASVSWAELRFGVGRAPDPSERARRQVRLDALRRVLGPGLPFDDTAADIYGTLTELVSALGRDPRRRALDLMIAATAAANGAAVITRNVDDFTGVGAIVPIVDGRGLVSTGSASGMTTEG